MSGLGLKFGLVVDESRFFCSVSRTMHIILYILLEDGNMQKADEEEEVMCHLN